MSFNLTTFVFEVVNFVVLLALLQRMVFRPLREGIDARRSALAERDAKLAAAEAKLAADESALTLRAEELDRLRHDAIREAAEGAAEERARILEQARDDAAADRQRAQRLLEAERSTAAAELRELAIERSADLAGRLLIQLAPQTADGLLLDLMVRELDSHGAGLRPLIRESPVELDLEWAKMPRDAERERLTAAFERVLERPLRLTHREDPTLMAGVRARVCNRLLDATVAGQVELLKERARAMILEDESRA